MWEDASELARRLGEQAEAVCRHYLFHGRRAGRYWLIGDVHNTPGRSMYVRLHGSPRGPAGKWRDAATGEHGDLLDVIRERCGLAEFRQVAEEARRFLSLPQRDTEARPVRQPPHNGTQTAARRLFAISGPIAGTLAERYLKARGIALVHDEGALRFQPRCYYRPGDRRPTETWPALIAEVTDLRGRITGAHRTYLDPNGFVSIRLGKADIETPRRAMGELLGHAVRFGIADEVLAAGEGIETMLSLRFALPDMAMAAALSANHLAALILPTCLRRLYIARDRDAAGESATASLAARAARTGIAPITLLPTLGDFNEDLRAFGIEALRGALRHQLAAEDAIRFMPQRARATA